MMEFNPDGSIKLNDSQTRQNELEKSSILITKEQISIKPAKAQIRIKLLDGMNIDEIMNFYYKIDDSQFMSVDHVLNQVDANTFIIKIDRGSMMMYGLLNFMVECFKGKLSSYGNVIVRGSWAKYGSYSF